MFIITNQSQEGLEKLREDIAWWKFFFGPALTAYANGDDKTLQEIVQRYQETNGYAQATSRLCEQEKILFSQWE
jgi:hypothetical protein